MDAYEEFSCVDPELSRTNVMEEVWMLGSNETGHEIAVFAGAVMQTLFVTVGVPWNFVVLVAILMSKLYKKSTYILLLNLVVADTLVYIFVLPFNIHSSFNLGFTIGNSDFVRCGFCHAVVTVILALVYISLFTLAVMSMDRFIYIKWPLHYNRYITTKKTLISLSAVWLLCLAVAVLPSLGIGEIKFSNIVSSCSLLTRGHGRYVENNKFIIILVVLGLFPFCTTVICNVWIVVIVYKTAHGKFNKKVETNKTFNRSSTIRRNTERKIKLDYQKQQMHLVRLFGALFVATFFTWVPTIVIALVSVSIGYEKIPYYLNIVQYVAYVSQPAIHPMLETCIDAKLRASVVKLWHCLYQGIKCRMQCLETNSNSLKRSSASSVTPLQPNQVRFHPSCNESEDIITIRTE